MSYVPMLFNSFDHDTVTKSKGQIIFKKTILINRSKIFKLLICVYLGKVHATHFACVLFLKMAKDESRQEK